MNNVPVWRIFRSPQARWLSSACAILIILGLCVIYEFATRERIPHWPKSANFNWTREVDLTNATSKPENAFTVFDIVYINGEFYASCTYRNTDPNQTALVQGVVGSYGRFWPKVTLEVTSASPPRWKRIGESPNLSGKIEKKAVVPGQSILVHVDLDPYRALIRKYRYARLVTETGASGVFELKDLLPPCEKWPPGMDCLPTAPEPELFPISEPEPSNEGKQ
jgi:hypothetical protein